MKCSTRLIIVFIAWSALPLAAEETANPVGQDGTFGSDPRDPSNFIPHIEERRAKKDSLLPVSPLKPIHNMLDPAEAFIYDKARLKLGLTLNHVFQATTDAKAGLDKWGTTTDADFVAAWEVFRPGKPTQGLSLIHI